jgi:selenium metabolism protein YedF
MKTVDAKGKSCPVPLIMTKKAINETGENEDLKILIDNETSMINVTRFLEEHGMKVSVHQHGNTYELFVNKTSGIPEEVKAEEYCNSETPKKSNFVVALQRDHLGDGDNELGKILIKALINTLPDNNTLPKTVVFLNSGIFLALKDSPVLDALKVLEEVGVELLICGTCLDFYKKNEDLALGKVSNMYEILERLSTAGNVLYP